ncbi:MAG: acyl-CoA thioesterase [Bacteroidia bacterium]|nr:acyl-CoA thioesterase [Bacteroidia bacterium]MDW8158316.1 acyl-CoA thioesterase [Bacteroidia bacterium]
MKPKSPRESFTQMTEIVLPNDTNVLGNLMGGRLLHWMDIVAAIAASRHSNRVVVTAAVDFVEFRSPIKLGEIVILKARVTRAFTTSMEVLVDVFAENPLNQVSRNSNSAFYTFVAVDQAGRPIPINPLIPETEEEIQLYESAAIRREIRLQHRNSNTNAITSTNTNLQV